MLQCTRYTCTVAKTRKRVQTPSTPMSHHTLKTALKQRVDQIQIDTPPDQTAPSVFVENFGKFERIGSTFTHKIRRPMRTQLVGHSKPVNQPEPDDKQALLKKIVRRLTSSSKNYLGPGCSIEFYQNRSHFDRDSIHLFTLYPDRWEPNPQILHWHWLIQFLNHFYTPTVEGYVQDLSGSTPTATVAAPKSTPLPAPPVAKGVDPFSLTRRFRNTAELNAYCAQLGRDGHAPGLVGDYMVKMLDKHNW